MTHILVICRFSEQRYMILNLCTFFGTPGILQGYKSGQAFTPLSVLSIVSFLYLEPPLRLLKFLFYDFNDYDDELAHL